MPLKRINCLPGRARDDVWESGCLSAGEGEKLQVKVSHYSQGNDNVSVD